MKTYLPTEPAFPVIVQDANPTMVEPGMSMRDWFAGMALQGFIADGAQRLVNQEVVKANRATGLLADTEAIVAAVNEHVAVACYKLADAMLAAKEYAPK